MIQRILIITCDAGGCPCKLVRDEGVTPDLYTEQEKKHIADLVSLGWKDQAPQQYCQFHSNVPLPPNLQAISDTLELDNEPARIAKALLVQASAYDKLTPVDRERMLKELGSRISLAASIAGVDESKKESVQ